MTFEAHRECEKDADLHVIGDDLMASIKLVRRAMADPTVASKPQVERLLDELVQVPTTTATCPFEGVVTMGVSGTRGLEAVLTWTCPTCGYEHREEPD